MELDGAGGLLCYQAVLEEFFDTPEQVLVAYTAAGTESGTLAFDEGFFQAKGLIRSKHAPP